MLEDIIARYSLEDVIAIEESDRQFLALKSAWNDIKNSKYPGVSFENIQNAFLFAVVCNSLISYQIAGSGELRWEEFAQKLKSDFDIVLSDFLQGNMALDRWYKLMTESKYNKRIYNIKLSRLKKMQSMIGNSYLNYYDNQLDMRYDLSAVFAVKPWSKTISFAVKMFGYAARVVLERFVHYSFEISIPVDSRIRKLFVENYGDLSDKMIIDKAYEMSQSSGIPPLHLDSLFWVKR